MAAAGPWRCPAGERELGNQAAFGGPSRKRTRCVAVRTGVRQPGVDVRLPAAGKRLITVREPVQEGGGATQLGLGRVEGTRVERGVAAVAAGAAQDDPVRERA